MGNGRECARSICHELVRLGMLESYHGRRPQSDSFLRFPVVMERTLQAINSLGKDNWLDNQIRASHCHRSFQTPDNIADAVRLISDVQLWNAVATHLGLARQYIRERLTLIVGRRNQIAHEADIDPSYGGRLWPINFAMVDEAVVFIEQLAGAIHTTVA